MLASSGSTSHNILSDGLTSLKPSSRLLSGVTKTKADVKRTLGITLSKPGKMPCKGWSLPAWTTCKAGRRSVLEHGDSAICNSCYARKGNYQFPNVQEALQNRFRSTFDSRWTDAMVILIGSDSYFRWHDAGDLYSVAYLEKILEVVRRTPNTFHWLPTRESALVSDYFQTRRVPANLTIRISGLEVNKYFKSNKFPVSNVTTSDETPVHDGQRYACPATFLDAKTCGTCRACWNPELDIIYKAH